MMAFPSMMGGGAAAPPTAPYPQSGYPATAFFGGTLSAATPGANAAPAAPPSQGEIVRTLVIIAAVIGVGYVAFHWNYNRK